MLDPELLKVLRCLDNGSPLSLATDAQLLAINEQIKQRGSGFEKSPDEGRKYGRAFRDG